MTTIVTTIATIAASAARMSPCSTAAAMYEPSPGSLMSLPSTLIASLCATKNQPPPKLIIEFQMRPIADAGSSSLVKRCQRDSR